MCGLWRDMYMLVGACVWNGLCKGLLVDCKHAQCACCCTCSGPSLSLYLSLSLSLYTHTYIYICIYTHTHIHIHTHISLCTYIYIYIYIHIMHARRPRRTWSPPSACHTPGSSGSPGSTPPMPLVWQTYNIISHDIIQCNVCYYTITYYNVV